MALTRKSLKAMGLTDEQVDSIIEMHTETVTGLKERLAAAEEGAKDLPRLQKELETAKTDLEAAKKDGWKDKHDKLKKDFDAYKAGIEAKESRTAKEAAVRAYFESKNIKDGNLTIAMRGVKADLDGFELDDKGQLKDAAALDALIAGDYKGLVTTTTEKGAPPPANPPRNTGGSMSKDDILKIKDTAERQAAIAANPTLFGL